MARDKTSRPRGETGQLCFGTCTKGRASSREGWRTRAKGGLEPGPTLAVTSLASSTRRRPAILIQATLLQRGLLLSVCTQYFASTVEVWYSKAIYLSYVLLIITYQCFATFYDNKDKNFGEGYKQSSEGNMSWIEKDTTHLHQVGAPTWWCGKVGSVLIGE